MFTFNFEVFKKRIEEKFTLIWPSTKSTPPTEANITATFVEIFSEEYYCYSEVPIDSGRIDLILVEKNQKEIVFCEFKSSKQNSSGEIKANIERLLSTNLESLFYHSEKNEIESTRVIFQWSENQSEIENNLEYLSKTFQQIKFVMKTINCEGAPLYCLFAAW